MSRTSRDRLALTSFLDRPGRPEDGLTLPRTYGFLFAVACAPELVSSSEWLPEVFGGKDAPPFKDVEQADRLLGSVMEVYNEVTALARQKSPASVRPARS
ncbi:MAG: UPF0149 family protein [Longimicrobiales bacterium]|nr:UPF0149 family protein [Longimicrobiales bacterium]